VFAPSVCFVKNKLITSSFYEFIELPSKKFSILTLNCDGIHAPRLRDLILDMWRPKLLCTLQHSSHNKIPRFMEAHVGSEKVINDIGSKFTLDIDIFN
jgi:hypothetical protein